MKKIILILMGISLFLAACAQDIPLDQVFACTVDADCVVVEARDCCGCPTSINKDAQDLYNQKSKGMCIGVTCEVCGAELITPPACINNQCSFKPIVMPQAECQSDADCMKSGCSGTICQSKGADPVMTTCEWREEYTCYQEGKCGCVNNKCEWGDSLQSCLQAFQ